MQLRSDMATQISPTKLLPLLTLGLWAAYRIYRYSRAARRGRAELGHERTIVADPEGAQGYLNTPAL